MAEEYENEQVEETDAPADEAPQVETAEVKVSEVNVPEAPAAADAVEPREPTAVVTEGEVPHAVVQAREPDANTAQVHEVHVQIDEVITDPSDPRAVQVPEAGKGDATLPIHSLAQPRPEDTFAEEAAEASDPEADDEARAERNRTGS